MENTDQLLALFIICIIFAVVILVCLAFFFGLWIYNLWLLNKEDLNEQAYNSLNPWRQIFGLKIVILNNDQIVLKRKVYTLKKNYKENHQQAILLLKTQVDNLKKQCIREDKKLAPERKNRLALANNSNEISMLKNLFKKEDNERKDFLILQIKKLKQMYQEGEVFRKKQFKRNLDNYKQKIAHHKIIAKLETKTINQEQTTEEILDQTQIEKNIVQQVNVQKKEIESTKEILSNELKNIITTKNSLSKIAKEKEELVDENSKDKYSDLNKKQKLQYDKLKKLENKFIKDENKISKKVNKTEIQIKKLLNKHEKILFVKNLPLNKKTKKDINDLKYILDKLLIKEAIAKEKKETVILKANTLVPKNFISAPIILTKHYQNVIKNLQDKASSKKNINVENKKETISLNETSSKKTQTSYLDFKKDLEIAKMKILTAKQIFEKEAEVSKKNLEEDKQQLTNKVIQLKNQIRTDKTEAIRKIRTAKEAKKQEWFLAKKEVQAAKLKTKTELLKNKLNKAEKIVKEKELLSKAKEEIALKKEKIKEKTFSNLEAAQKESKAAIYELIKAKESERIKIEKEKEALKLEKGAIKESLLAVKKAKISELEKQQAEDNVADLEDEVTLEINVGDFNSKIN